MPGLVLVGPLGAAAGMSKLVEVHFLEVATRGESAVLAPRWEATGPGSRLFPALDADIWLTPAGGRRDGYGPCWPASRTFSAAPRSRPAPCSEPT